MFFVSFLFWCLWDDSFLISILQNTPAPLPNMVSVIAGAMLRSCHALSYTASVAAARPQTIQWRFQTLVRLLNGLWHCSCSCKSHKTFFVALSYTASVAAVRVINSRRSNIFVQLTYWVEVSRSITCSLSSLLYFMVVRHFTVKLWKHFTLHTVKFSQNVAERCQ